MCMCVSVCQCVLHEVCRSKYLREDYLRLSIKNVD